MSIEEHIKKLEEIVVMLDGLRSAYPETGKSGMADVLRETIALLRTHQDAQPNEPLTLEEMEDALNRMDGGLHIWIDDLLFPGHPIAGIVDYSTEIIAVAGYKEPIFRGRDYGKTWLANLRRPPKEDKQCLN